MSLELINGQIVETNTAKQTISFYDHPVLDVEASEEANARKYKMLPYIKIETKGNTDSTFSRLATEQDKTEHAAAWAAFTHAQENGSTALSKLPLEPTRVLELSSLGYQSVEQLAQSEEAESTIAKAYLELAEQAK